MGLVTYGQPGYVGCSMSVNAVIAYESGEKPKSKWTKREMLCEIEGLLAELGAPERIGRFSKLTKQQLFRDYFKWSSWHHTGKYARCTEFYRLNGDAVRRAIEGR